MKHVMMLIAVLAIAPAGAGQRQDADDYRGGGRRKSGGGWNPEREKS